LKGKGAMGEGAKYSVSQDAVIWAYRLFFNREPEDLTVVERAALSYKNLVELRSAFLNSTEFKGFKHPKLEGVPLSAPPIAIEWEADAATMDQLIAHVRDAWTELGRSAPHWSVLSAEDFLPEHISQHEHAFYDSGATEVETLRASLARLGFDLDQFRCCYEYGCGVGRVTLHLARSIQSVTASDISSTHLQLAYDLLSRGKVKNVKLIQVETGEEFGMSEPFDLWYSKIVLQHNPPPLMVRVLRRALSMLSPGGLAVFQVPTYALGYEFHSKQYLAGIKKGPNIEMHCLPQRAIFQIAKETGCIPLETREDDAVGHPQTWISNYFVLQKEDRISK
jgi:SAM-dependent methyltransferase